MKRLLSIILIIFCCETFKKRIEYLDYIQKDYLCKDILYHAKLYIHTEYLSQARTRAFRLSHFLSLFCSCILFINYKPEYYECKNTKVKGGIR